jgi:hypothetical protein
MTRKCTIALLEMMDDGVMDPKAVAEMCLAYMSEADVEDMMHSNDLLVDEDGDEDDMDCDDSDDGYALASAGYGMDEDY